MDLGWTLALEVGLTREFWELLLVREIFLWGIVELAEEICEVVYGGMLIRVLPLGVGMEVA